MDKDTKGLQPKGLRPKGLRPKGLRPKGLRPKGLRPKGLRPEVAEQSVEVSPAKDLRPKAAQSLRVGPFKLPSAMLPAPHSPISTSPSLDVEGVARQHKQRLRMIREGSRVVPGLGEDVLANHLSKSERVFDPRSSRRSMGLLSQSSPLHRPGCPPILKNRACLGEDEEER